MRRMDKNQFKASVPLEKGGENECFIDSGVTQGSIMFTWLLNVYSSDGSKNGDGEDGRD